jgi:MarR family 2-MHQ and catechol resistance regulon transcriptional repressor
MEERYVMSGVIGARFCVVESEIRALEAFIELSRATESLARELQRSIAGLGLTPEELWQLSTVLEREPVSEREIAATIVDRLEGRGLLRRGAGDGQPNALVSTTESGRRVIQRTYVAYARRLGELMSVLGDGEQAELGRLCSRLTTKLGGVQE